MSKLRSPGGVEIRDPWGRPRPLTKTAAEAYSRELKAKGRCGTMLDGADHLGVLVCGCMADICEKYGEHEDSRHGVVWESDLGEFDVDWALANASPHVVDGALSVPAMTPPATAAVLVARGLTKDNGELTDLGRARRRRLEARQ